MATVLGLNREAGHEPPPPLGEHVVEQHGVDAAEHEIAVRMHVVVVRRPPRCRDRARRAGGCRTRSCRRAWRPCGRADRRACGSAARRRCARSGLRGTRSRESSATSAARRAGVSSMPLRPMSASPRAIDWSIDVNVIMHEPRRAPRPRASRSAISTSKPTTAVRVRRVGFDERRAALGIARPAKLCRRLRAARAPARQADRPGRPAAAGRH